MNDRLKKLFEYVSILAIAGILVYLGLQLPILGILVALPIYFVAKKQHMIILSSIMLGLMVGLLAYNFIPRNSFDLTRHWSSAKALENVDTMDNFITVFSKNDFEIIPQLYSWFVAKIGDYNILQFFPVAIGYGMLFYILADYRRKVKLSGFKFTGLLFLIVFGQSTLYYFSGLYNYFAINLFAFAVYLDYVKNKKILPYVLYAVSPFVHTSLFLPLVLLIILKIRKNKINVRFASILLIGMLFFGSILSFMANQLGINFFNTINRTYNEYITMNGLFMSFYDGGYLYMSLTKIALVLLICWVQRKSFRNMSIRNLAFIITGTTIVLSISSIAMTRFTSLALFVALPLIADELNTDSKSSQFLTLAVWVLAGTYAVYNIYQVVPLIKLGGA